MYVSLNNKGDKLIVHLMGELDHHSAEMVRNKIDDTIERQDLKKLILDFSGVSFMDSSGIGVVIGRYKKITGRKGSMCIVSVNESTKKVFELSGLFKILKLYDNLDQALESM